jgi:hypothetical protein
MQAHYTRLFTDERGVSCFEDLAIELQPGFSAPGLEEPILSAPFLACELLGWRANYLEGGRTAPGTAPHDLRDDAGRVSGHDERRRHSTVSCG